MATERRGTAVVHDGRWALVADIDPDTGNLGVVRSVRWHGLRVLGRSRVQSIITHDRTGRALSARPAVASRVA